MIAIDENLSTEKKSEAIANLLLELEHESFLLSRKLEGIVEKICAEMPKVESEIENLEIAKLKSEMKIIHGTLTQRHTKSQSVEMIAQLDKALEKVKSIQTCLKDADNWNSVPAEMEALFASSNFEKIIVRLQEAESSLNLLSVDASFSNFEDRKKLVQQFKERTRRLLLDKFVDCLETESFQDGKNIVQYLKKVSSFSDAYNALFTSKKSSLMEKFNNEVGIDAFPDMISLFLADFLIKLRENAELLEELFDQPRNAASYLVSQAFALVQPNTIRILKAMASNGSQSVLLITGLYKSFVDFGLQFENLYPMPSRARSSIVSEPTVDWGEHIFSAFLPFQMDYESLERKYLNFRIKNIDKIDSISIIDELVKRYLLFTSGVVKLEFHSLVDWFLCSVIDCELENVLITHYNPEELFPRHISTLKSAIDFIKAGNVVWKNLDVNLQREILACSSSTAALKDLRREYQVNEKKECYFNSKSLELIKICQRKVLDALIVPVEDILAGFAALSCWSAKEPVKIMSPLFSVTRLGEYVLTLPQQFDRYSQDDTLSFSMKTLPMVNDFLLPGENESSNVAYDPAHIWIISAARIIEDCYASHILKIPFLSPSGMNQLLVDTEYLQNVLSAIEIEPFGRMAELVYGLSLPLDSLKEEVVNMNSRHDIAILKCLLKIRNGVN